MASGRARWVLLAYRLPREPSTPRIGLWRNLRRLGAAQVLDGLAALPFDARNREQLEWLAEGVVEAGGDATIWIGELASVSEERDLVARMSEAVADDYRVVIADVAAARAEQLGRRRRTLARLRRELRRVKARDYFPSPERERAQRAVDELATVVDEAIA